ncbi:hypothetical protein SeMB42_g01069 [Synchytrium endobioticum]|uniref:Uncharacterized protein n=1 Tax=Synchytrium endobioticum TaxID=286115 RepID=A0A507DP83_9FUNG|nr:hypothetical protein SeMB42_g01069 [Synchytrium endobioticum]
MDNNVSYCLICDGFEGEKTRKKPLDQALPGNPWMGTWIGGWSGGTPINSIDYNFQDQKPTIVRHDNVERNDGHNQVAFRISPTTRTTLPQFLFNVRRIGPTNVPKLIRDMRNAVHMQKMKFTAQQMLKII